MESINKNLTLLVLSKDDNPSHSSTSEPNNNVKTFQNSHSPMNKTSIKINKYKKSKPKTLLTQNCQNLDINKKDTPP